MDETSATPDEPTTHAPDVPPADAAGAEEPISPEDVIGMEMNAVLQEGLRVGAEALTQAESFRPFGIAYRPDGRLERAELTSDDPEATISAEDAHRAIFSVLKQRADELHAIAVVSDVVLSQDGEAQHEAIRVELEHRSPDARSLAAWATYTRDEPGSITFSEELGTSESARRIWI